MAIYDVVALGADPTGATSSDTAFATAYSNAASAAVANSGVSGETNLRGRVKIVLPPGRYKLTADNAMMAALSGSRVFGITYEGAGPGVTEILWQPASSGKQLFRNNDIWLGVNIRGISFLSATAGSRWFYSSSTGGAQNYLIEDCSWIGAWEYGLGLDGTNTNSEITFRRPLVEGTYSAAWWWIGTVSGVTTQDQFLNYEIQSPSVGLLGSTWIKADYGGNFRISGGNYILNQGASLYVLNNNAHSNGVESLVMVGGRIEHRNVAPTTKTIDSAWGRGSISFINVDEDTQTYQTTPSGIQDAITHRYMPGNSLGGPSVLYQNCRLQGRHEYGYGYSQAANERTVVYDLCETKLEPHSFIVQTGTESGGNGASGNLPLIDFRNHRTRDFARERIYDQRLNWNTALAGQPLRRTASMRTTFGGLPSNTSPNDPTVNVWLPMNAIVTAVRFYKPFGGAATNTNWQYDVKTSEGTPTTLGSVSGGGTVQWTTGFNEVDTAGGAFGFVCNSDVKRHLVLSATNVTGDAGGSAFVLVDYIA